MTVVTSAKHKAIQLLNRSARAAGQLPRRAYAHLFIEGNGVHSRLHLHHFYSLFLPDVDSPVTLHLSVFDASGQRLGTTQRVLKPFASMLLPVAELLAELGGKATFGSVAVDEEPTEEHTTKLLAVGPEDAAAQSPFWMGFWDEAGSVAYVHSIDQHFGEVYGVNKLVGHVFQTPWARGGHWTSNRLIETQELIGLDAYVMNQSPEGGETTVRWLAHPQGKPVVTRTVALSPRGVARVSLTPMDLESAGVTPGTEVRLEVENLFTGNGKPYVLARYGNGPFSLHHG